MKKHKDAIKSLRLKLKGLMEAKPELRAKVHALKFDAEGKRRPETGPQRWGLKQNYNDRVRPEIRVALLAYGILRGVPYKKIEPNADMVSYRFSWVAQQVRDEIRAAIGDDEVLKAEWTKDRVKAIIFDGADPVALEAA